MSDNNDTPTATGARKCAEWLQACKEIGWRTEDMGALADIFWKFRDRNGNPKSDATRDERAP